MCPSHTQPYGSVFHVRIARSLQWRCDVRANRRPENVLEFRFRSSSRSILRFVCDDSITCLRMGHNNNTRKKNALKQKERDSEQHKLHPEEAAAAVRWSRSICLGFMFCIGFSTSLCRCLCRDWYVHHHHRRSRYMLYYVFVCCMWCETRQLGHHEIPTPKTIMKCPLRHSTFVSFVLLQLRLFTFHLQAHRTSIQNNICL